MIICPPSLVPQWLDDGQRSIGDRLIVKQLFGTSKDDDSTILPAELPEIKAYLRGLNKASTDTQRTVIVTSYGTFGSRMVVTKEVVVNAEEIRLAKERYGEDLANGEFDMFDNDDFNSTAKAAAAAPNFNTRKEHVYKDPKCEADLTNSDYKQFDNNDFDSETKASPALPYFQ